jgi:hypothetical protein
LSEKIRFPKKNVLLGLKTLTNQYFLFSFLFTFLSFFFFFFLN